MFWELQEEIQHLDGEEPLQTRALPRFVPAIPLFLCHLVSGIGFGFGFVIVLLGFLLRVIFGGSNEIMAAVCGCLVDSFVSRNKA